VNGWADQALALPEAQHHPDRSILLAARAVDLMINGTSKPS
jgi:hypothetical protein